MLSVTPKDANWITKFVILVVLLFIPILGWAIIYGYGIRVIKMVSNGEENALPEWDDWGGDLTRGIMAFIGYIVYYLPSILLSCVGSVFSGSDSGVATLISCCFSILQIGYSILIIPFFYTALARFAQNDNLNEFFDFGGVVNTVTSRMSDVMTLYINLLVLGVIMFFAIGIGFLLLCIPGLIALAASSLMSNYLAGQWGRIIGAGSAPAYS